MFPTNAQSNEYRPPKPYHSPRPAQALHQGDGGATGHAARLRCPLAGQWFDENRNPPGRSPEVRGRVAAM